MGRKVRRRSRRKQNPQTHRSEPDRASEDPAGRDIRPRLPGFAIAAALAGALLPLASRSVAKARLMVISCVSHTMKHEGNRGAC